jgi:hypothetical protein
MQKAFNSLAMWLVLLVVLVAGTFGFALPAVFNMDSDLMFVALPFALLVFVVIAWWVASRLVRSVTVFRARIDERINNS